MRASAEMLLVAAYWSSYVLIGGTVLAYVRRFKPLHGFIKLVQMMPLGAQAFVSWGIGFVAMAPWIIIGFAVDAPTKILVVVYILYAVISLGAVVRYRQYIWNQIRGLRPAKTWVYGSLVAVTALLAADYVWSLYIGAFIANGNDAYVHMAKIEQLVHGHMTLSDPYFNGVIESRYHFNFIHALNAVGAQSLHIQTIDMWTYSYPFFRLMCWLGTFTLAWYFSPMRNRRLFASCATIVSMAMLVNFFAAANYPNIIVLSWVALLIIGLSRFVRGEDNWLLVLSGLLIGMTHPAYGVGTAGLVVLVGLYLGIFERAWLTVKRLRALAITLILLLWPAVLVSFFPNRLSDQVFSFGTQIIHVTGRIVILRPNFPSILSWSTAVILLSLVGYAVLIKSGQCKREKVVLGLLVMYFVLIAYNPVVSLIAGKQLPPWMLTRFQYVDRLSAIAAIIGVIYVATIISKRIARPYCLQVRILMTVLLLMPLAATSLTLFNTYRSSRTENRHEFIYMHNIKQLAPLIHGRRIFALSGDSFILPAVTVTNVITMPATNASPVANMSLRQSCADYLAQTLSANGLATAGVTRVVVGAPEISLMQLAKQKPYLHVVGGNSDFLIFGFNAPHNYKKVGVCNIPHGQ